jgi:hypothetical protein
MKQSRGEVNNDNLFTRQRMPMSVSLLCELSLGIRMNCKGWVSHVGHKGDKKEIRNFTLEMRREETIWETEMSHPRRLQS